MIIVFVLAAALLLLRTAWVLVCIRRKRRLAGGTTERTKPIKTLVILGSGGHTTEMILMIRHLNPRYYHPLEYCVASTDTTSVMRIGNDTATTIHEIPRAREVGQSYATSILTTIYAQLHALILIAKIRPGLVLCNGPGTAVPICVAALVWRIAGLCPGQVVFVESYCRVNTLSLTGKLLYPWVDLLVVHWEELRLQYPHSHRVASFVD